MNATELSLTIIRNGIEIPLTISGDLTGEDYQITDATGKTYHDLSDLTSLEWEEVYAALEAYNR